VTYALEREAERLREPLCTGLVALEQVIRHPLGGFRPDAGKAA
jgi:hypothetical protein